MSDWSWWEGRKMWRGKRNNYLFLYVAHLFRFILSAEGTERKKIVRGETVVRTGRIMVGANE